MLARILLSGFLLSGLSSQAMAQSADCNWTGTWATQYGDLRIIHSGNAVSGDYGPKGTVTGEVTDACIVNGTYLNTNGAKGSFKFSKDGTVLQGEYGTNDGPLTYSWTGSLKSAARPILVTAPYPVLDVTRQTVTSNAGGFRQSTILATPTFKSPTTIVKALPKTPTQTRDEQLREMRRKAAERTTAKRKAYIEEQARDAALFAEQEKRQQELQYKKEIDSLEKATWKVHLEGICAKSIGGYSIFYGGSPEVFGIAWIRARVIDKSKAQHRQIELAPNGGFTRLNGDKERVWEIQPSEKSLDIVGSTCGAIGTKLDYSIEFKKYGYHDIHEFLSEDRNRFDVMFKLSENRLTHTNALGTYRAATSFEASDFCGLCERISAPNGVSYYEMPSRETGNGIVSGFKDGETRIQAYYQITPKEPSLKRLYDQPDLYAK